MNCNRSAPWQNNRCFGNNRPTLLRNIILVNINIISISIQTAIKDKRRIHKRARIDQTALFSNLHLFNVKNKTSIKNLES